MVRDFDLSWCLFDCVILAQMFFAEVYQLEGRRCRDAVEKHILRRDQNCGAARTCESVGRTNLREDVIATVRRRRSGVFLHPSSGKRIGQAKIIVRIRIPHYPSTFGDGSGRIAGAGPSSLYEDYSCGHLFALCILREIASVLRQGLSSSEKQWRYCNNRHDLE